jgi:hypothetical protein
MSGIQLMLMSQWFKKKARGQMRRKVITSRTIEYIAINTDADEPVV